MRNRGKRFMETYSCKSKKCTRKGSCNHYNVKPLFGKRIPEDLSDLCQPDYRLYVEGDYYSDFPPKAYYKELLEFYDNGCKGIECREKEAYDSNEPYQSSRIECKLGKEFTCKHPSHPKNIVISKIIASIKAEEEAFNKAGIEEGTVTYICPICGGEAVANRYMHGGRLHGMGSYCKGCETSHT